MKATELNQEALLLLCCNREQPKEMERGWRLFWRRYQPRMRAYAVYAVHKNLHAGHPLFKDVVNDILSEAMVTIRDHIASFRHRDSEERFAAWLSILINRVALRYMQKNYSRLYFDNEQAVPEESAGNDDRWELYEYIVHNIRRMAAKNSVHTERDIALFLLYAFADFSPEELLKLPCNNQLSLRAIQLALNRLKQKLKKVDII
ncbi:MAG: sigma-70 family RNA polymerase sigma factor [Calditrichaeota bacterium]|nr:MAG: sigma-70 family RNA polymerase sigma factor [Calditrichota bacterium]